MVIKLNFDEVHQYFREHPEVLIKAGYAETYGIDLEDISEVDEYELDPAYWLGEAKESVLSAIMSDDSEILLKDGKITGIIIDLDLWQEMLDTEVKISNDIAADYDAIGNEGNGSWKAFGLGGDDDVDYNGGYLDAGFDLIKYYIEAHKDTLKDFEIIMEY